jgi:hypothetical protein
MSQSAKRNRTGNRLLDRLPPDESDRLLPLAETVSLRHLEQLHEQDGPLPHVYFPKSGVLSSVIAFGEGRVVEAATIGNEGMVGIPALLGLDFTTATATSQVPGDSLRIHRLLLFWQGPVDFRGFCNSGLGCGFQVYRSPVRRYPNEAPDRRGSPEGAARGR